ncbi:hypothetical protein CIHG_02221 [Coccidioides immitis H538.4]|uniref:Uncharacterized protein n=1 Tax=Coccidioides immitis H538.4 TaxID=396776 RepID=A0A0J8RIF1_COCIT|nr:hypothetical protein CIHG_02221 [Coccidioides immitis H538.4]
MGYQVIYAPLMATVDQFQLGSSDVRGITASPSKYGISVFTFDFQLPRWILFTHIIFPYVAVLRILLRETRRPAAYFLVVVAIFGASLVEF